MFSKKYQGGDTPNSISTLDGKSTCGMAPSYFVNISMLPQQFGHFCIYVDCLQQPRKQCQQQKNSLKVGN